MALSRWVLVLLFLLTAFSSRPAHAQQLYRSCVPLLSLSDKKANPKKEAKEENIRRDLDIDPEIIRRMIREFRQHRLLHSSAYETYKNAMKSVAPETATERAQTIKSAVQRSAELIAEGRIEEAIQVLNNAEILEGTGFKRQEQDQRDTIYADNVSGSNEREYARNMVRGLNQPPMLEKDGTVVIPEPPTGNPSENKTWAQREWVRIAAEELLHVAQNLQEHSGQSPILSQTMSRSPRLQREIQERGVDLNEQNLNRGGRLADWTAETDVYASMIEIYGSWFIPPWVGQDSGYTLRRHVDEVLTQRGMRDREWISSKALNFQRGPSFLELSLHVS